MCKELLIALSAAGFAMAQVQTTLPKVVGFSPAPLWPKNGDTSPYPGRYVFFNPSGKEYIVSYPRGDGSGENVVLHVATHRSVDPIVTTNVSVGADGRYLYSYTVENSTNALTAIDSIAMVIEQSSSDIVPSHASWAATATAARPAGVALSAHGTVVWTAPIDEQIKPGAAASAFTVTSDLAPGYTMVSFHGQSDVADLTPVQMLQLPPEVSAQLASCKTVGWDTQVRQIIGPRFSAAAPVAAIAANFAVGISSANRSIQRTPAIIAGPQLSASGTVNPGGIVSPVRARLKLLLGGAAEGTSTLDASSIEALLSSATTSEDRAAISALGLTLKHNVSALGALPSR